MRTGGEATPIFHKTEDQKVKKMNYPARKRTISMDRQSLDPIDIPQTIRRQSMGVMTSMPAGRLVPLRYAPIFREDSVVDGKIRVTINMHETAELLENVVLARIEAWLVPWLAMERFTDIVRFNQSYNGDTGPDIPDFFETMPRGAIPANPSDYGIIERMGLHEKAASNVNTMPLEAYNIICNYRYENRSERITQRTRLDTSLAPALWNRHRYDHIRESFDQAMYAGEVPLQLAGGVLPVKGLGFVGTTAANTGAGTNPTVTESGGGTTNYANYTLPGDSAASNFVALLRDASGAPDLTVDLAAQGLNITLANIDQARNVARWAKSREKYSGHSEEYLINLLMQGITVPDQEYQNPHLLDAVTMSLTMGKRNATDAANLTESVAEGATGAILDLRTPRISTGGILMVVAEVVPDQLYERQQDPFFSMTSVDQLPNAMQDLLDEEPVDVVQNNYFDTDHANTDTGGYEPMNAKFNDQSIRVGGRFYRPAVDGTYDEDREPIWAVEQANPTLNEDFYLATNITTKPFVDQNKDPFDVRVEGQLMVKGLTQFGPALIEAQDNYAKVLEQAPTETVEAPAP